jgi:hypothetical protein
MPILQTPADQLDFRFPGTGMWGFTYQALSVYRVAGEWFVGAVPDPSVIDGLEVLYRGGFDHTLTRDEADELIAAGFSDYIIEDS